MSKCHIVENIMSRLIYIQQDNFEYCEHLVLMAWQLCYRQGQIHTAFDYAPEMILSLDKIRLHAQIQNILSEGVQL